MSDTIGDRTINKLLEDLSRDLVPLERKVAILQVLSLRSIDDKLNRIADALEGMKLTIDKSCGTCRRGKVEGETPRDLTRDTLICAECGDAEYSQWTPKLDKNKKDGE